MNKTVTLCFIDFQILHLNQLSFNVQNTLHKWNSCSCTNHFIKESQSNAPSMQGRILGEGAGGAPPPPEITCSFLIQLVFCKKKNTMWFIGVEVEQETSAPPPKKILDPPLQRTQVKFYRFNSDRWIRLISINRFLSIYRMIFRYQFLSNDYAGQYFKRIGLKTLNWLLLKINLLCTLNLNGFQCFIQHFAWSQTNVWSFEGLWAVLWMTNYT